MSNAAYPPLANPNARDPVLARTDAERNALLQSQAAVVSAREKALRSLQEEYAQATKMAAQDAREKAWRARLNSIAAARAAARGERYQPIEEHRAFWEKILDVLLTGNYASASFALALKRGDPNVWSAVIDGIKNRTTYGDVFADMGVTGKTGFLLGLVADIFLDPVTYIPVAGQTTKGRALAKVSAAIEEATLANRALKPGVIGGLKRTTKYTGEQVEALKVARRLRKAGPKYEKEARIILDAVRDGEKAFLASTFPERVAQGTQRFLTIEKPAGFFKIPLPGNLRVPIFPKFDPAFTVGGTKAVKEGQTGWGFVGAQVKAAETLSAIATITRQSPGVKHVIDFVGRKVFNQWMRPPHIPPYIWGPYSAMLKTYRSKMAGRKDALLRELDAIATAGNIEGGAKRALERVGLGKEATVGNPLHDIWQHALDRKLTAEQRKVLMNMADRPMAMLIGSKANIAEILLRKVMRVHPDDALGMAITEGSPDAIRRLIKNADEAQLKEWHKVLLETRDNYADAITAGIKGKPLTEDQFRRLYQDMDNVQAALDELRLQRGRPPTEPPPSLTPGTGGGPPAPLLPKPIPAAPSVGKLPPETPTVLGTAGEIMKTRAALQREFQKELTRSQRLRRYAAKGAGPSEAAQRRALEALGENIARMNRIRSQVTAIDEEIIRTAQRLQAQAQEAQKGAEAIQATIQDLSKRPTLRQKAVDVLPEAQEQRAALDAALAEAQKAGDGSEAGKLMDQIQALNAETLASRAARLGETPEEQARLLQEYFDKGARHQLEAVQREAAIEEAKLRELLPEGGLAAPSEQRAIEFKPSGTILTGPMKKVVAEEIRGRVEDQFRAIRQLDPNINLQVSSVEIVGRWASKGANAADDVGVAVFFKGELSEDALAIRLSRTPMPIRIYMGESGLAHHFLNLNAKVTPWRLARGQTKKEVMQALGALPPNRPPKLLLQRPTEKAVEKSTVTAVKMIGEPQVPAEVRKALGPLKPLKSKARDDFEIGIRVDAPITDEQGDLVMITADAHAYAWGAVNGEDPVKWYETVKIGQISPEVRDEILEKLGGLPISGWARGMTERLWMPGPARIVEFTESANFPTVLHELAHVFRGDLPEEYLAPIQDWMQSIGTGTYKRFAVNEAWPETMEESFVDGFLRYYKEGTAPTPEMEKVFAKYKDWLRGYWNVTWNSVIGGAFPIEVQRGFSDMLGLSLSRPALEIIDKDLQLARQVADDALNSFDQLRTSAEIMTKQSHIAEREALFDKMHRARVALDDYERRYGPYLTNRHRNILEKARHDLEIRNPSTWRLDGPGPTRAARRAAGNPRKRQAPRTIPPAPLDADGNPIVNTAVWREEFLPLLKADKTNIRSLIQEHEGNLVGWRKIGVRGKQIGEATTDEVRNLSSIKSAEFDPRTHAITVQGEFHTYKTYVRIGFQEDKLPRAVKIARSSVTVGETQYKSIYEAAMAIRAQEADTPLFRGYQKLRDLLEWAKKEPERGTGSHRIWKEQMDKLEAAYIKEPGIEVDVGVIRSSAGRAIHRKAMNEAINTRLRELGAKAGDIPLRGSDVDMAFEIPKGYQKIVGQYADMNFGKGVGIRVEGKMGVVIGEVGDGRRVLFEDGKTRDFTLDEIHKANYRAIMDDNASVVDYLLQSARRADGSTDQDAVEALADIVMQDHLVRREFASELVDTIIKGIDQEELLFRRQYMVNMLEKMFRSEESRGLIDSYLNYYAPRFLANPKKWKGIINGRSRIQIPRESFMDHRTIEGFIDEINKNAKAMGLEPVFLEDMILAMGLRGSAHIRATETHDFLVNVLGKFGVRIGDIPELGFDFLSKQDVALGVFMEKMGAPKADIEKALTRIARLKELEGSAFGKALSEAIGKGGRGEAIRMTSPAGNKITNEIIGLRNQIEELVPEWGFYIPRGQVAKFLPDAGESSKLLQELRETGELTLDEFDALVPILQNAFKSGDAFIQIPHTELWALKKASRHVDAFMLPAGVAQHMNGHLNGWTNLGEDLAPLLRMFDTAQNWWKQWTLGIFPVYHVRNAIGNIWNCFLAGAYDPETWSDGGHFLTQGKTRFFANTRRPDADLIRDYFPLASEAEKTAILKKGVYRSIMDLMTEHGLLDRGAFAADMRTWMETRLAHRRAVSRVPAPLAIEKVRLPRFVEGKPKLETFEIGRNVLLDVGMELGNLVENHAKISLFLDGLKRGMGPELASRRVRKYLFDYDDLTQIERNLFRRIFPFYTWTRKNIPLQIEHLITKPAKFTGLQKAITNFTDRFVGPVPDERLLPEWMKDQLPVPARQLGDGQYAYFVFGNWIPAADLVKLMDPAALASGMITPLAKAPVEWATNYSLFFENNIERFPRETSEFLGFQWNKHTIALMRNIRFLNMTDKLLFQSDLPWAGKVWQQFVGRLYPIDFHREREFKAYEFNRESSALKASLRRERKKLDAARRQVGLRRTINVSRLERTVRALEEDLQRVEERRRELRVGKPRTPERTRALIRQLQGE